MTYPLARLPKQTEVTRELTSSLWRTAPDNYDSAQGVGTLYGGDDFKKPVTNSTVNTAHDGWFLSEAGTTGATSESAITNTNPDGVLVVEATTGTDLMGVKVQAGESATQGENIVLPSHASTPKGNVVAEARVYLLKEDTTASLANDTLFVGLAEPLGTANALLLNDNTLTLAADYIGFYRLNNGDLQFVTRTDNDGNTAVEDSVTIVAAADLVDDDFVNLGFRVNADLSVEIFYNKEKVVVDTSGTRISINPLALPIENLTRTLAASRGATLDNATVGMASDYFRVSVEE